MEGVSEGRREGGLSFKVLKELMVSGLGFRGLV